MDVKDQIIAHFIHQIFLPLVIIYAISQDQSNRGGGKLTSMIDHAHHT